jgi:MFS family permease
VSAIGTARRAQGLERDRLTWLAYGALGAYAYILYSLGPLLPFLRDELHLSYTLMSLHSSLYAAGAVLAGLWVGPVVRRVGRRAAFWGSIGSACLALGAFAASPRVGLTLTSVLVLGTAGALLQALISAVLSDRHGARRTQALTEANVVASGCAVTAPLLLGLAQSRGPGWRLALLLPVLVLAVLFALYRRDLFPTAALASGNPGGRLPQPFWVCCGLVALVVGIEFCVLLWAAEFLHTARGLSTAVAASAVGLFYGGELAGRVAGAWLSRGPDPVRRLLPAALLLTGAGFLLFWLPPAVPVCLAGLAVTGLGVANLYPLALSLALAAAPGQADAASGRTQMAVGLSVVVAPLLLGALADRVGVPTAFALVVVLVLAALGLQLPARQAVGAGYGRQP